MRLRLTAVLVAATAAVLAAGCADAGAEPVVEIAMEDNFFHREVTRIEVGDTVRFTNTGQVPHNAIDVDGAWSTGEAAGGGRLDLEDPGGSVEITFDMPGRYTYFCSLHAPEDASSGMVGTLVVGDVEDRAAVDDDLVVVREWTGVTRRVPDDHPTIQNAVDAAEPGDLVLVGPAPRTDAHRAEDGRYVYREQVDVTTPFITIRGTDRNEVIVDAEHERPNAIAVFAADGVAVENLTARNATGNGVFWTSVTGYRGSYLTAYNNALYGIYAFDSVDGLFEHSYASGSADGGFYIGQCDPCDAVLTDVLAERNALGYSGTNSSDVYIVDSVWRHNVVGIVPNTLDSQRFPPSERVTIVGNLIHDNDDRAAPAVDFLWPAFGNGIVLFGGLDALVERNRIVNHERSGVLVTPMLHRNFWMTGGNVVRDNVIDASGYADLTLSGPAMAGNCFAGNTATRTEPRALETIAACGPGASAGAHGGAADPDRGWLRPPSRSSIASMLSTIGLVAEVEFGLKPEVDHRTVPAPPPQPQLPGGADAPVRPAVDVFATHDLDLAALAVPDLPDDVTVGRPTIPTVAGVPVGLGWPSTLYGVLGWLMPFALFAAWVAMAVVDVARRRDELTPAGTAGRLGVVLLVPFVGAGGYLAAGAASYPRWLRLTVVLGGFGFSLVAFVSAVVVGGLL